MGGRPISVSPGFRRYQKRNGIGDFVPGLLRPNLPIAIHAGKWALSGRSDVLKQAPTFLDSHPSALGRAMKTAIHAALHEIDKEQQADTPPKGSLAYVSI